MEVGKIETGVPRPTSRVNSRVTEAMRVLGEMAVGDSVLVGGQPHDTAASMMRMAARKAGVKVMTRYQGHATSKTRVWRIE